MLPRSLDKVDGVTGIRIERTGSFRLSKKKLLDPVEDFRANSKTEGMCFWFNQSNLFEWLCVLSVGGSSTRASDGVHQQADGDAYQ